MDIEKIRAESDLAKRAELIAKDIHHGEKRRNEEPYITHPRKLVKECSPCLKESEYRDSTRAAGWVHDSPENKEEFTIDILGELLRDFGKKGRYTTYMVDRCTKRESEEKYVIKTLNLHESGVKKDLDLHAMLIKIVDRDVNIDANEEMGLQKSTARYQLLEGQPKEAFEKFYRAHGIWRYFRGEKEHLVNEVRFVEKRILDFNMRNYTNANLNLTMYLPIAEEELQFNLGVHRGRFDESKAIDNPFFNYKVIRRLLKKCYRKSLIIMENTQPSWGTAYQIRGYKPVLHEMGENLYL